MVGRAAGDDEDAGDLLDVLLRQVQVLHHNPAVPDAGRDGLAHGLGLLHDLLEHEVGIAPLLRGGHIPVHLAVGLFHGDHLIVKDVDAVSGEHGNLPVVHVDHVPGVLDDGRHV